MADDSKLSRGLQAAAAKVKAWGAGINAVGSGFLLAGMADIAKGAAIVAPLAAAAKVFADTGSALNDMADRTGFAVEELSALQFAAEQSGASMEDVEKAIKNMQKEGLGSGLADFARFADEIAAIEDPAKRTARAVELFGKSGTKLLPILSGGAAGIAATFKEAADAGLILTTEQARQADALGDSWDKLLAMLKMSVVQVGAAAAPVFKDLLGEAMNVAAAIGTWVRENQGLFVSLLKLAGLSIAFGAAEMAVGILLKGVGLLVTGLGMLIGVTLPAIKLGFAAVAGSVSLLLSPLGLVLAAVGGITAAVLYFSGGATAALAAVAEGWTGIKSTALSTWEGIVAAIKAGNLEAAFRVAILGIKTLWLELLQTIKFAWQDMIAQAMKGVQVGQVRMAEAIDDFLFNRFGLRLRALQGQRQPGQVLDAGLIPGAQAGQRPDDPGLVAARKALQEAVEAAKAAAVAAQVAKDARAMPIKIAVQDVTQRATSSSGTFSAQVARLLGTGSNIEQQQLAQLQDANVQLEKIEKVLKQLEVLKVA